MIMMTVLIIAAVIFIPYFGCINALTYFVFNPDQMILILRMRIYFTITYRTVIKKIDMKNVFAILIINICY